LAGFVALVADSQLKTADRFFQDKTTTKMLMKFPLNLTHLKRRTSEMENTRMCHTMNKGVKGASVRRRLSRLFLFTVSIFLLASGFPGSASAGETAQPEGWQFGADVYLWMISLGGETTGGDTIDVPFDNILENLDFAFSGNFHARNGKWHLSTDVIYLKVEGENSGQVDVPGEIELKSDATVKMESWTVTPVIGYAFVDTDRVSMEVIAGARYLYMKPELAFDITGSLNSSGKTISDSGNVWDGIVGIRGVVRLAKGWYVPYYADIGTGDSDYTWQAMAGVGYRINQMVDVVAAYRYMEWKFDNGKVLDSLDINGPLIGLKFRF
jgi:opacity protein-like surface antigen